MEKEKGGAMLWPQDDFAADEVLCINFVNTVSWRGKPKPEEYLSSLDAWLEWMREEGIESGEALAERANETPDEASLAFERAIQFREALYRYLKAFARAESPTARDRSIVQDVLSRAMARLRLRDDGTFELAAEDGDWDAPLYPCALSAAQLVAGKWAQRLRVCERRECEWMFLDLTKNRSRKWCDMKSCGNVVKARRSYAKKKALASR